HLVALLRRQEMRRLARDDAVKGAVLRPHRQLLAEKNLHVPAADRLHVEEAAIVDVLHHEGDLVAMPGEHDARPALRIERRDDIAVLVGADLVGQRLGPAADHVLDRPLEAGRARRFQEALEEGEGMVVHGGYESPATSLAAVARLVSRQQARYCWYCSPMGNEAHKNSQCHLGVCASGET